MSKETSNEIWEIFCKVYGMKIDNPKSSMQVELLAKLTAYVDSKSKEKSCSKK